MLAKLVKSKDCRFIDVDSSSENNVGNGALFGIGLHGSGDVITHFLHDREVAKVALSCQRALDMLYQELHEVERRRGWFGFCARPVFGAKEKEANNLSF